MVRDNVPELYTPIYDEFMLMTFAEDKQVHPAIFESIDDSTKEYKTHGISGLGEWEDADEAAGGGYEDPVPGYLKTYTQSKKWKKLTISFEALDQDEYAILKKQDDVKAMGRGARVRVERNTSEILYNGFSVAGPDGQYLISAAHPKNPSETGVTYDNLFTGPLSHDNMEIAEKQISDNWFDPKGLPIETAEKPIIAYAPALKGLVARLFGERADDRPQIDPAETSINEVNRFRGQYNRVEWRYLGAKMGGSDTAWYIIFKELGLLKIIWSAKPSFDSWIDKDIETYNFKGRMLYDPGCSGWRALGGSTGL